MNLLPSNFFDSSQNLSLSLYETQANEYELNQDEIFENISLVKSSYLKSQSQKKLLIQYIKETFKHLKEYVRICQSNLPREIFPKLKPLEDSFKRLTLRNAKNQNQNSGLSSISLALKTNMAIFKKLESKKCNCITSEMCVRCKVFQNNNFAYLLLHQRMKQSYQAIRKFLPFRSEIVSDIQMFNFDFTSCNSLKQKNFKKVQIKKSHIRVLPIKKTG